MPNQSNFVQIIPPNPTSVSISRIAELESDKDIIQGRISGLFGYTNDDNIEMHFYDGNDNLAGTVIIPVSTGIITGKTVLLPNGEKEEKIIVDMTRVQKELGLLLTPATYTVSMNFFRNEIGSYNDKKLVIEEISPSRTEIRLGFDRETTDKEADELYEFVQPSIQRVLAAGFMASTLGVSNNTNETNLQTAEYQRTIFIDLINTELNKLVDGFQAELIDLEINLPDELNRTIDLLAPVIYEQFITLLERTKNTRQFDRIQADEMRVLVTQAIDNALINTPIINVLTSGKILYI